MLLLLFQNYDVNIFAQCSGVYLVLVSCKLERKHSVMQHQATSMSSHDISLQIYLFFPAYNLRISLQLGVFVGFAREPGAFLPGHLSSLALSVPSCDSDRPIAALCCNNSRAQYMQTWAILYGIDTSQTANLQFVVVVVVSCSACAFSGGSSYLAASQGILLITQVVYLYFFFWLFYAIFFDIITEELRRTPYCQAYTFLYQKTPGYRSRLSTLLLN